MQKSKSSILAVAAMAMGLGSIAPNPQMAAYSNGGLSLSSGSPRKHRHNPAGTKLAKAVAKRRLGLSTIR